MDDNLVGLIYDAALEPTKWPELLSSLVNELGDVEKSVLHSFSRVNQSGSVTQLKSFDESDKNSLFSILSHLDRAIQIADSVDATAQQKMTHQALLERFFVPTFIVDANLRLVDSNTSGASLLLKSSQLYSAADELRLKSFKAQRELQNAINDMSSGQTRCSAMSIRIADDHGASSMSVLLSREHEASNRFLLMVACADTLPKVDAENMRAIFGLTSAEVKLVNEIVSGASLGDISKTRHVSLNTLRTQLKSIFSKTATSRQADLVRLVLTSPLMLETPKQASGSTAGTLDEYKRRELHQCLMLSDGRQLGYAEFGDLKGVPVFVFHPSTGSRLQSHPNNSIAKDLGVRVIVADRPGLGLSDPLPARKILDWPADVEQLADYLGLDMFSVIGFCGGGPYALACAHELSGKLSAVTCVSGVTPFDNINLMYGVSPANKLFVKLATQLPSAVFKLTTLMAKGLVKKPEQYLDHIHAKLCKTDQQALCEPELLDNFQLALSQAFKQGPKAFTEEQLLFSESWHFSVRNISMPVTLWHGEEDCHVNIELARKLAATLPNGKLEAMKNYGHFLIYHRWRDILSHHLNSMKK